MVDLDILKELSRATPSRIVLLVIDGLGGLPHPATGKTEMETASTPNLDGLCRLGSCGLVDPVAQGITPGSAPGHMALFGYEPVKFSIGRGVLEALGTGFDLQNGDVAARGNFCTVDDKGVVTDRRAGRLSTARSAELCRLLQGIRIEGVQTSVLPLMEHRFAVVFRGKGLVAELSGSDPQLEGKLPRAIVAQSEASQRTAGLVHRFVSRSAELLADHHPANMILLRGFSQRPDFPSMGEVFKLRAAAIATYPMYRGLAKLVGMTVLDAGVTLQDELAALRKHYQDFDFFFLHVKKADSAGEDGDFERKVRAIEEVDAILPEILALKPEVLMITGDHSTPAAMKSHSWHPVPFLLASQWCRSSTATSFSERECARGELGRFPSVQALTLALAHGLKLDRFGA